MKKNKFEFIIDSEFQSQIPALTDEEFQQLEENILSEGEVLSPLIVWGNILVDGHNRYKILQQHPEISYTTRSISCTCETREDVLAWICKHQLGRRNLTPEQKKFLIGKQYHSEKSTRGGNHGNQYTQVANCQIDNLPSVENTTERIAKENNVSPSFVIRAEQFMKTVELMEKYCPGIQEEILSGKLKLSQREATIIRGTPTEALPTVVSTWREEKLNGKKRLDISNRLSFGCKEERNMGNIALSDAAPGKRYTIQSIKDEARLVNRLSFMGLVCGSPLEVCQNLKKQPVLVFARDTLVAIGREESKKSWWEVPKYE